MSVHRWNLLRCGKVQISIIGPCPYDDRTEGGEGFKNCPILRTNSTDRLREMRTRGGQKYLKILRTRTSYVHGPIEWPHPIWKVCDACHPCPRILRTVSARVSSTPPTGDDEDDITFLTFHCHFDTFILGSWHFNFVDILYFVMTISIFAFCLRSKPVRRSRLRFRGFWNSRLSARDCRQMSYQYYSFTNIPWASSKILMKLWKRSRCDSIFKFSINTTVLWRSTRLSRVTFGQISRFCR